MAVLFAAVDGTGPDSDAEYAKSFEDSFCHKLKKKWDGSSSWYLRGPYTAGWDTGTRGEKAATWVEANRSKAKGVILAGHSRGGAAVIHGAYKLMAVGIDVDYLFLFDAVNMQALVHTHIIPKNVKNVFHAVRSPYTLSRRFWGNCGCTPMNPFGTSYVQRYFSITHSGVGGVPWQDYLKKIKGENHPDSEYIWEDLEPTPTLVTMGGDKSGSGAVGGWMFAEVEKAVKALEGAPAETGPSPGQPNVGQPVGGGGGSLPGKGSPGGGGGGTGSVYTVVSGDSLSAITGRLWGDVLLWPLLYDANKTTIGSNPNLIKVGQKLTVPNIKGLSPSQLDQARTRGRNWR